MPAKQIKSCCFHLLPLSLQLLQDKQHTAIIDQCYTKNRKCTLYGVGASGVPLPPGPNSSLLSAGRSHILASTRGLSFPAVEPCTQGPGRRACERKNGSTKGLSVAQHKNILNDAVSSHMASTGFCSIVDQFDHCCESGKNQNIVWTLLHSWVGQQLHGQRQSCQISSFPELWNLPSLLDVESVATKVNSLVNHRHLSIAWYGFSLMFEAGPIPPAPSMSCTSQAPLRCSRATHRTGWQGGSHQGFLESNQQIG